MAIAEEMRRFVRQALARGLPREEIQGVLEQAGWTPEQVRGGLREFAPIDYPVPVPVPRPYLSAREAFLYLVLFSTLYLSAFNLGALLFQLIDLGFPDPNATAGAAEVARDVIRWSIAFLVVSFPVFAFVARVTEREAKDPVKRASKVRRWLTALTLFVAGSWLLGDLTSLVYNLLGGDLTARFLLKSATVAAIAGPIFVHYLRDLQGVDEESRS